MFAFPQFRVERPFYDAMNRAEGLVSNLEGLAASDAIPLWARSASPPTIATVRADTASALGELLRQVREFLVLPTSTGDALSAASSVARDMERGAPVDARQAAGELSSIRAHINEAVHEARNVHAGTQLAHLWFPAGEAGSYRGAQNLDGITVERMLDRTRRSVDPAQYRRGRETLDRVLEKRRADPDVIARVPAWQVARLGKLSHSPADPSITALAEASRIAGDLPHSTAFGPIAESALVGSRSAADIRMAHRALKRGATSLKERVPSVSSRDITTLYTRALASPHSPGHGANILTNRRIPSSELLWQFNDKLGGDRRLWPLHD